MNSIVTRLTLAFLLVGLAGALLVALFVRQRTRSELDTLVQNQFRQVLVEALADYYQVHDGWQGLTTQALREIVPAPIAGAVQQEARRTLFLVTDQNGEILLGGDPGRPTPRSASPRELQRAEPITVAGETVGYLVTARSPLPWTPGTPEGDFLRRVNQGIVISAMIAALLALVLGGVLAYTLTRQLRELTRGTQEIARGRLGHQVQIQSSDEMGQLAASFNQMSAELQRSNELRQQMTADIAHDLRTPLSVILGYTEALADGKLPPDPEMLAVMHQEALHLQRLIEDLKILALADAGELPLNLQLADPAVLLRQAAEAHRVQASHKNVGLETRLADSLPSVRVDIDRMAQVFGNLLSNALRYTPEGGIIRLSARQQDGQVLLEVSDSGPGIPPEVLPQIFERTVRGDPARQQQQGETGLGLAIARSLVEAQGGTIKVRSLPGEGAVFTIQLPTGDWDGV